jgi:hypothetical protein
LRLALTAKDCERLGCPAAMDIDLSTLTNREAVLLQALGFPSVSALGRRLQFTTNDVGDTLIDYAAWDALVWLALRRSGIDVDVHTFEYDVHGIQLGDEKPQPLPGAQEDPGKAEGLEASTNSPRKRSAKAQTSRRRSTSTGSRS